MGQNIISVIIPYKNLNHLTQLCVDSLCLYNSSRINIILIDDGSDKPGNVRIIDKQDSSITVQQIRNDKSVGWCKAINQGARLVSEDSTHVIFLNNDTVMVPGWQKILEYLDKDLSVGIVGPTTNHVSGYQHIDYNGLGVDFQEVDEISGFFMTMRKDLFDQIKEKDGYWLDEKFGNGGQDDTDLCWRVKKMGYKIGIARNIFIYHYGSATFRKELKNNIPLSKEYAKSRENLLKGKYLSMDTPNEVKPPVGVEIEELVVFSGSDDEKPEEIKENTTPSRKPIIMIAIPTLGNMRIELLPRLIYWSKNERYNVVIPPDIPVLQPLDNARNYWVKRFLEISNDPDDRLWFIDDDIIPPFDALDSLAGHNKDAVGATCFVMKSEKGEYFPYPVALRYNNDRNFVVYYGEGLGLERVNGTGGGCIMVKRKVYETMDRPYEFKYYPDGSLELVADFHFCQKLEENGFELWYDFNCICDHIKAVSIKGINDLMITVQRQAETNNAVLHNQ